MARYYLYDFGMLVVQEQHAQPRLYCPIVQSPLLAKPACYLGRQLC